MKTPTLIIVNGSPASGKTTLATYLSAALNIPAFGKDDLKELLSDHMNAVSIRASRRLDDPSTALLFSIAKRMLDRRMSLIIEGNFVYGPGIEDLARYLAAGNIGVKEILVRANGNLLVERFRERMETRHPIHPRVMPKRFVSALQHTRHPALGVGIALEVDTSDFAKIPYREIVRFARQPAGTASDPVAMAAMQSPEMPIA